MEKKNDKKQPNISKNEEKESNVSKNEEVDEEFWNILEDAGPETALYW